MIVLGVILLLLGYFLGISILYTVGGILLVIGLVLWIAGSMGRGVGGRSTTGDPVHLHVRERPPRLIVGRPLT